MTVSQQHDFSNFSVDVAKLFIQLCDPVSLMTLRRTCKFFKRIAEQFLAPYFGTICAENFSHEKLESLLAFLQTSLADESVFVLSVPSSYEYRLPSLKHLKLLHTSGLLHAFPAHQQEAFRKASFPSLGAVTVGHSGTSDPPLPFINPLRIDQITKPPGVSVHQVNTDNLAAALYFLLFQCQSLLSLQALSAISASLRDNYTLLIIFKYLTDSDCPKKVLFCESLSGPMKNQFLSYLVEEGYEDLFYKFHMLFSWSTPDLQQLVVSLVRNRSMRLIEWLMPRVAATMLHPFIFMESIKQGYTELFHLLSPSHNVQWPQIPELTSFPQAFSSIEIGNLLFEHFGLGNYTSVVPLRSSLLFAARAGNFELLRKVYHALEEKDTPFVRNSLWNVAWKLCYKTMFINQDKETQEQIVENYLEVVSPECKPSSREEPLFMVWNDGITVHDMDLD